jgi:cysteine-rich repeat protein
VTAKVEPAGSRCEAGGIQVNIGLDANRNGVLDPGEITTTTFICNGVSQAGTDGGAPRLTCTTATDCLPSTNECLARACTGGFCDFANVPAGVACTSMPGTACNGVGACTAPGCGDGIVESGETCDDGNTIPGDGCSSTCTTEVGFTCTGMPSICIGRRFSALGRTFNYVLGQAPTQVAPDSGTFPLVQAPTIPGEDAQNQLCDPLVDDFTGHVVIAERGGCIFYQKAINAQTNGAAGLIIYNNVPLSQFGSLLTPVVIPDVTPPTGDPPITIPVVMIRLVDGAVLVTALEMGQPVTITWLPLAP